MFEVLRVNSHCFINVKYGVGYGQRSHTQVQPQTFVGFLARLSMKAVQRAALLTCYIAVVTTLEYRSRNR